jgi:HlyD family secretion protein
MHTTRVEGRTGSKRVSEAQRHPIQFALLAVAAVVALIVVGAVLRSRGGIERIPTATVRRGEVEIKVVEAGELRASEQATISASNDKQIIWLAPEGSWVEEGDPLVKLASDKYEISRRAAESALLVAKAELRRARSDLAGKRAVEERARLEYEALPELAQKGYINRSEVERARLALEEVRSDSRGYQAAVSAARANVSHAEQDLREQERKFAQGSIVAPRAGLVVYATFGPAAEPKKISVGMVPFEGQDLMYLPDTSRMIIDAAISEFDLAKVRVGSDVQVQLDAYANQTFRGRVTSISTLARPKISQVTGKPTGLKVFDASIEVLDEDDRLRPGLSATVEILVSRHEDVLYVPLAGIFVDESERTVVYTQGNGGAAEAHPVRIGESNDRVAIVEEGLEEGSEILLARPASL